MIREAIMQAPTPSEARKTAAKFIERRRMDWRAVRSRVLRAGLMMAAEQNADVRGKMRSLSLLTAIEVETEFGPSKSICGYPLGWYAGLMWEAADAIINKPNRILITSGKGFLYSDKRTQIAKYIGQSVITQVLVPVSKETSMIGEEFALHHQLPLKYLEGTKGKFSASLANQLANESTQIFIFEKKGSKLFDQLIVSAKSLGKPVKLALV